jgi:hypothetical protein
LTATWPASHISLANDRRLISLLVFRNTSKRTKRF